MVLLLYPAEGEMHIARFCSWRGPFCCFFFPFVSLDAKCKHNCRHSAGFVIRLIANTKVNNGMKEKDKKNNSNSFRLLFRGFFLVPCQQYAIIQEHSSHRRKTKNSPSTSSIAPIRPHSPPTPTDYQRCSRHLTKRKKKPRACLLCRPPT